MSRYTIPLAANTTGNGTLVATAHRRRDSNTWQGTIFVGGTFGAGTVALFVSPDAGASVYAMPDLSGTAFTATANRVSNITLGGNGDSKLGDNIQIYAQLTGATTPALNIILYTNE